MICLVGNRPVLQVGNHQIVGYGVTWIETALSRASIAADRDDFPFIEDIRDGIIHYLENKCPLRLLPIEDLYARMRRMLDRIGCSAIGDHLKILTPPVTLSLARTAREMPAGFELGFFQRLGAEVDALHQLGTEEVHFTEIHEATLILVGVKSWNSDCEAFKHEILAFLEKTAERNSTPQSQLLLTLDAA
ncbi:hypothetical protein [Roseibacillus persicicus]|uniref:Uncharacterized protein n=1 Tax=Roseibacillus persicicus TaxID=454148 RepID=A0A918TMW3_9BACT|nr:hypothetical protein [Roseibacillus persicicus]MDQ8192462.1 hypothetical protein [Roseibacillus persicicus]GHC52064.1 hypothetical protein GCM10007100_17960 [Roseibacillus persicicus]